jgi:membrane protein involved in colicin uptake
LQAQLETARAETEAARLAASEAERRETESAHAAAQTAEKAEKLATQLAALKAKHTRAKDPNAGRGKVPNAAPETTVPDDFDARTEALGVYLGNPKISGKDLGAAVGKGERWGQMRKAEFATAGALNGQDPEE